MEQVFDRGNPSHIVDQLFYLLTRPFDHFLHGTSYAGSQGRLDVVNTCRLPGLHRQLGLSQSSERVHFWHRDHGPGDFTLSGWNRT